MSLDFNFNKSLSTKEIEEKTSLKVIETDGLQDLVDTYGNTVFFKGYGITLYGLRNPTKILDELINAFGIMFIDDDAEDKLHYEPEKYKDRDLYFETMETYGYVIDGVVKVPEREESEYLPYKREKRSGDDEEFPF
jgi:hypothetical protein